MNTLKQEFLTSKYPKAAIKTTYPVAGHKVFRYFNGESIFSKRVQYEVFLEGEGWMLWLWKGTTMGLL